MRAKKNGISKLERRRNEEIRQDIGQVVTLVKGICKQTSVAWTCLKNE